MVAPWTDVAAAVLLAIQFQEITFPGPVRLVCGFHFWHDSWARCHFHYSQTEIELHILCLPKAFCRISSPHLAISLWPLFLSLLELFARDVISADKFRGLATGMEPAFFLNAMSTAALVLSREAHPSLTQSGLVH